MLTGSLGLLPSASLGAKDKNGKMRSMYEPVHGSAPDIAGKNLANPIAQILTGAMMLSHLGENKAANDIREAVVKTLKNGNNLTSDLGGTSKTDQCTNEIIRHI